MKKSLLFLACVLLMLSCRKQQQELKQEDLALAPNATQGIGNYLGVTLGFQYSNQLSGPVSIPSNQNQSMYNPDPNNPDLTWQTWAEQLGQAGVDFICPNLTGSQPNANGSPVKMAPMLTALNNLGLASKIKFAIFDDNAASWCAQWNLANGRGYGYAQPFDISNPDNWKYIYDWNYKLFYQTIPDANRFKINGRPVIIIWTGNTFFIANMNGNASKAINYVRQQCQHDFGFNPYIILSQDFFTNDPSCNNAGVADGRESWFTPPNNSWSLTAFNGVNTGVAVAQFQHPGVNSYLDPNHGALFENGLMHTAGAGALLTLCEGFTDYEEEAAMWRAANLDANGNTLSYSQTGYDFPNQRLNLLRKYSQTPFPATLKLEAEGCDNFGGANGGNGKVNYYRNGNIAIATTADAGGGHQVGWIANNEWLEWQQVPFNGTVSIQLRMATPNPNMQAHLEIDGVAQPVKTLPNTGDWSAFTTFDFGTVGTYSNAYHRVRIVFNTGNINVNWIQVSSSTSSSSSGVVFYQNPNYGGSASQALPVGSYTLSQLAAMGVPNDWASSVKIPSGRTITMYSDDNFSGTSWTRTADTPDFSALSPNANDVISSVVVQ